LEAELLQVKSKFKRISDDYKIMKKKKEQKIINKFAYDARIKSHDNKINYFKNKLY